MGQVKVTVIVPVYNAADTLESAVASLTSQTLTDLEIILVDDASSDQSARVMQWLAENDSRIKPIYKTMNEGAYEARRSGLGCANGKWVGFIDADDYVEPDMFRHMAATAEAHCSDIVICGVDRVSPSRLKLGIKFRFRENRRITDNIFEQFCRHEFGTGSLWNKLYSRPLITKHGCQSLRWRQDINEDTLVNIGCFLDARAISILTPEYYHYVDSPSSVSSTPDTAKAVTEMLRAYALAVDIYGHRGMDVLKGIDVLYRSQLSYPCYFVDNPESLYQHQSRLAEMMSLLSSRHPVGASVLISYLGRPKRKSATSFKGQWKIWCQESRRLAALARDALSRSWSQMLQRLTRG